MKKYRINVINRKYIERLIESAIHERGEKFTHGLNPIQTVEPMTKDESDNYCAYLNQSNSKVIAWISTEKRVRK